jgi:hypothetical protein
MACERLGKLFSERKLSSAFNMFLSRLTLNQVMDIFLFLFDFKYKIFVHSRKYFQPGIFLFFLMTI